MGEFKVWRVKDDLIRWIREWMAVNGRDCHVVIGISGGKDSTVVAALCKEALGKERVTGVLLPDGEQEDIEYSREIVKALGIRSWEINIEAITNAVWESFPQDLQASRQSIVNLPPRVRMAMLYAVSQSINGRVVNTGNLSENWVGYATRYGDTAGDFAPLADLTAAEVIELGYALGLEPKFVEKIPSDGLCGRTDEDNLGFTYEVLDRYIRTGICEDEETKAQIDILHDKNKFKLEPMPGFSLS